MPFGQVRADVNNPIPHSPITQTDFNYTGQRNLDSLGLMDYHARFYDAALMRWTQPDSVTPGGPQGLNRFSYVNENPIRYIDPSRHRNCEEDGYCPGDNYTPPTIKSNKTSPLDLINQYIKIDPWSTCSSLIGTSNNPICDPRFWNTARQGLSDGPLSIQSMINMVSDPTNISGGLDTASMFEGFGETISKVHWPVIGVVIDGGSQYLKDKKYNYTPLQRVLRMSAAAGEGQAISLPASSALDAIEAVGIPTTGPVGFTLGLTVYVTLNQAGSSVANQFNQTKLFPMINRIPNIPLINEKIEGPWP